MIWRNYLKPKLGINVKLLDFTHVPNFCTPTHAFLWMQNTVSVTSTHFQKTEVVMMEILLEQTQWLLTIIRSSELCWLLTVLGQFAPHTCTCTVLSYGAKERVLFPLTKPVWMKTELTELELLSFPQCHSYQCGEMCLSEWRMIMLPNFTIPVNIN